MGNKTIKDERDKLKEELEKQNKKKNDVTMTIVTIIDNNIR